MKDLDLLAAGTKVQYDFVPWADILPRFALCTIDLNPAPLAEFMGQGPSFHQPADL